MLCVGFIFIFDKQVVKNNQGKSNFLGMMAPKAWCARSRTVSVGSKVFGEALAGEDISLF